MCHTIRMYGRATTPACLYFLDVLIMKKRYMTIHRLPCSVEYLRRAKCVLAITFPRARSRFLLHNRAPQPPPLLGGASTPVVLSDSASAPQPSRQRRNTNPRLLPRRLLQPPFHGRRTLVQRCCGVVMCYSAGVLCSA